MSQAELLPTEALSPSVSLHSGRPATTSLEVAKFFGKRHDNVCRDIKSLLESTPENFGLLNFEETPYMDSQNGQNYSMFILYRDGFMLLVMGYTGKKALAMKLAYIEAFNRMEAELAASSRPLADDMVLPASPDRPSRRSDPERKQLTAIINTWVGMAPIHYAAARAQVNAHFGVASVDALTVAQVREAIQWVQGKIDALPAAAPTRPRAAGDEERYLRFLERLEETRRLIHEHSSDLCIEAARLLPKELLREQQFGNALGWLIRWIMEEISSPMPRGRGGLLRDDNYSPLYILMQYGR